MSTPEEKLAAIAAIVNDAAPVTAPAVVRWWRPTPAQAAAFAAKVGQPLGNVLGWNGVGPNTAQTKISPVATGDIAAAKEYAGFGYRPDGTHYLWTQDWIAGQRDFADLIFDAPSAAFAEAHCTNAQSTDPESVVFQIMVGLTSAPKFTPFVSPQCKVATIEELLAYLQQQQTPGGPGPGIG